ncbi:CDP-glycerol glycerophosphotransferase family protein [Aeribacillus sp. FSL K6-1121]|uniref:CDP-glycerol glycerophosphotransferase family protein n=1 Tax=Aeribacillus sp. FSL K6-1121 TaxID=2954745 RepID=UPI001397930D|nr:CDP-glycerol glycerophosphotransferase [Aeribacillus pallidus]
MITEKLKKKIKNFNRNKYLYYYQKYYKKLKIQQNCVLIESTHGANISGHMFYILQELEKNYNHLNLFVAAKNIESIQKFLNDQNIKRAKVVKHLSKEYCRLLASAKYLFNDTTFYPFFNKKEGQIYINIWHGTPLKKLGKDLENVTEVGNVQKNFYMTDKIIVNNEYTRNIIEHAFNISGVYQGKMVVGPSPRNSVMFDEKIRQKIRSELGVTNEKIYFYMPTWRGSVGRVNHDHSKILSDLEEISGKLQKNEIFFVKLHPFQANIDLSEFENIYSMPEKYEVYQFLTAVDVLITDYSSVMYDFLVTGRKIVLYTYDKEDYFSTRGVYEDIDDYPFVQAKTVDELLIALRDNKTFSYKEMQEKFCPFDNIEGTKILCDYLFNDTTYDCITETDIYNGKKTTAIFCGGLWDNGITSALLNTLNNIDTSQRNYILFFERKRLKKEHFYKVRDLPEGVLYYPIPGGLNGTFIERIFYKFYFKYEWFKGPVVQHFVKNMFLPEQRRFFGDLKIDDYIHYTGFDRKFAELLSHLDENINKIIFVHTDMFKEYEAKKSYSKKIIFGAYKKADKIAIVNGSLKDDLENNLPFTKGKIFTVNNFFGEKRVRELAKENIFATILPTSVTYAYVPTEKMNFQHLNKNINLFLQSHERFQEYNNLNIRDDLDQLMKENHVKIAKRIEEKINLANEIIIEKTIGKSKSRLLNELFDENIKFFINIGRFAYEKGHERLIEAFEKVNKENPNTRLIIIAPHGPLKNKTVRQVRNSSAKSSIYILGRMSNPYALLKLCDAFVLSSYYEALGLVVFESLAVGTAVITVDLEGTVKYLQNNEAIIVENSTEGLYQGMRKFLLNPYNFNSFNFEKYTKQSIEQFNSLLNHSLIR